MMINNLSAPAAATTLIFILALLITFSNILALPIATNVIPGGRQPISNQTLIEELTTFIPKASSNGVCRVTRVLSAQQQVVAGTIYYLVVEVSTSCDATSSQTFCEKLKIFRPLVTRSVENPQLQLQKEQRVDCNTPA
ncbi:hypothetical protein FDP41_003576 [Naegleria fowleri]|uniref:Cystatin domain-containing protein n=1 Tax=Naegleria fowleri TaxID=5763 RepID=A0A6A5BTM4_NAEFO|nr:uncharacterized protein FDP41_003576 [Naegleria fowleri]KAF0977584.1 hypothetical protein FDP41_003576 [Naegleria fowleri]CAG4711916.1 unnamed protein product [Naegleria fowleri]